MASSVIHMAVASEINKTLKRNIDKLLVGSIAPDLSKHIGESKIKSHFLDEQDNFEIPHIDKFLDKYKVYLDDDFVMGYYIHLLTDYLWFKYFIPEFDKDDYILDLKGNKLKLSEDEKWKFIYNDYTNLNIKLIDNYNLVLNIFYEPVTNIHNIIEEIPMDKIQLIIDKTSIIIENSKNNKNYIFDEKIVCKFISISVDYILDNLNNI